MVCSNLTEKKNYSKLKSVLQTRQNDGIKTRGDSTTGVKLSHVRKWKGRTAIDRDEVRTTYI